MGCKLTFAVALSKSLLGAKTQDGSFTVFDGDSLIAVNYGQDPAHPLYSDQSIDVTSTGVKQTLTFKYVFPTDLEFAADVIAHIPFRVTSRTGSGGTGRINLKVSKNGGVALATANGPTSGTFFDADSGADSAPGRSVILRLLMPKTTFAAGDTLDFVVEVEVTATGTGTSEFRLFHNPQGGSSSVDARTTFEVNV